MVSGVGLPCYLRLLQARAPAVAGVQGQVPPPPSTDLSPLAVVSNFRHTCLQPASALLIGGVSFPTAAVALFNAIVMPLALEGQVRGTARWGKGWRGGVGPLHRLSSSPGVADQKALCVCGVVCGVQRSTNKLHCNVWDNCTEPQTHPPSLLLKRKVFASSVAILT